MLFATCYLLLASCYLLLFACFSILATCYLNLATRFILLAMCFFLLATFFLLLDTDYVSIVSCFLINVTCWSDQVDILDHQNYQLDLIKLILQRNAQYLVHTDRQMDKGTCRGVAHLKTPMNPLGKTQETPLNYLFYKLKINVHD